MNPNDFYKLSDQELNEFTNGTKAVIGSNWYLMAQNEQSKREIKKRDDQFNKLIDTLTSLKDKWLSKLFWLIGAAIIVNIVSDIILFILKSNKLFGLYL